MDVIGKLIYVDFWISKCVGSHKVFPKAGRAISPVHTLLCPERNRFIERSSVHPPQRVCVWPVRSICLPFDENFLAQFELLARIFSKTNSFLADSGGRTDSCLYNATLLDYKKSQCPKKKFLEFAHVQVAS